MNRSIAVVGLGYVGLPLAVAFGKHHPILGFDIAPERVAELRAGTDRTGEVAASDLKAATITFTNNPSALAKADFIIVAVPTPIDAAKRPDLSALTSASRLVGENLKPGSVVVYESTVYPGTTEEVCVPLLEQASGLTCGEKFAVGYSPERINPGDREHTLERIVKVVSGMDVETLETVAAVYGTVCQAGVYRAPDIRTAEAAKVIENIQRDLNIALVNELALIFNRLGMDTIEVLKAAGTKWNFLPFRPGLVGGHCIGVDPYYLTHKAETLGYHPQVILAGRRINDGMGQYVADQTLKLLVRSVGNVKEARIAVLGLTFKENVPDLRNSRVKDIVRELNDYGLTVHVHDPIASPEEAEKETGLMMSDLESLRDLDAVILAVQHRAYVERGAAWLLSLLRDPAQGIIVDIKSAFRREDFPNTAYWRV